MPDFHACGILDCASAEYPFTLSNLRSIPGEITSLSYEILSPEPRLTFFAALLTSSHAKTLPVMVASQTGSQGISWWSMAALSFAAILPLIVIAIILERYIIKGMAAGAVK